jgi:heme-degrading monooxygenase HmoA
MEVKHMAHMRISVYKVTSGSVQEVARRAESGMLAIFRQQPGFIAYEGVGVGTETIISLSTWQTAQQADAATRQAADWVGLNIASMVQLQSNYVGDVLFSSR